MLTRLNSLLLLLCMVVLLWMPPDVARANLIVNGDFEINSATDNMFNPDNALFNSTMSSVTAYGAFEGIDILRADSGYGAAPYSGNWKVAVAACRASCGTPSGTSPGGVTDELSLALSTSVISGLSYALEFQIERLVFGDFDGGRVEIGVSSSATSFGTLVFTSAFSINGWTLQSTTFVAPANSDFLTVRMDTFGNHWVGLDDVSLVLVPEPGTGMLVIAGLLGFAGWRKASA